VPLFEETEVVADLVAALDRLNWPKDRLDILFVTEACDDETRRALVAAVGDRDMRIVVVPEGTPRTKPRALMYALGNARGEYVVVHDAEDEPAPDQLRLAYARLSVPGSRTVCVQAQLNVYNVDESLFSRQFTIEYTALFDAILPALPALRLPVQCWRRQAAGIPTT
jgi:cellulose synthase/poly-beta-1,6-N-acetylglucosamine synthase-like glycosyltransferase